MTIQPAELTVTLKPTIYGIGINDVKGSSSSKSYTKWNAMLGRCYGPKRQAHHTAYHGCEVAPEWLSFSAYKEWHDKATEALGHSNWCLDKDILYVENKMYSPARCLPVSAKLNSFMVAGTSAHRDLPTGVSFYKLTNRYQATLGDGNGKMLHLGYFTDPRSAHAEWARCKRNAFHERFTEEFNTLEAAGLLPEGWTAEAIMQLVADTHWPNP